MSERHELKYFIRGSDGAIMSSVLSKFLDADNHSKDADGYFIRSMYFDTFFNRSLYEKLYGVPNRKKYRLRAYDLDAKKVKFEIKHKSFDLIKKDVAYVRRKDVLEIQKGNYDPLLDYGNPVLNKIYLDFKKYKYGPVVIIDYQRKAFVYDINNVRITLDSKIASNTKEMSFFEKNLEMEYILNDGIVVLEVKYNDFMPKWIRKLIHTPNFTRSAISKYCYGRFGERVMEDGF